MTGLFLHNCSICDGRLSGCLDYLLDVRLIVLIDCVCVELLPSPVGIGCCCDLIQASVSLCSNALSDGLVNLSLLLGSSDIIIYNMIVTIFYSTGIIRLSNVNSV